MFNLGVRSQEADSDGIYVYLFSNIPETNEDLTKSAVNIPYGQPLEGSPALTLCLRFSFSDGSNNVPLYDLGGVSVLITDVEAGFGYIMVGSMDRSYVFFNNKDTFPIDTFISVCIEFVNTIKDGGQETLMIVVGDQEVWTDAIFTGQMAMPDYNFTFGSSFLIGDENFPYDFNDFKAGHCGRISDINAWTRPLTIQEMKDFTASPELARKIDSTKKILDWDSVDHESINLDSNIKRELLDLHTIIKDGVIEQIHFDIKMHYDVARDICHVLGGHIPYPKSAEAFDEMKERFGQSRFIIGDGDCTDEDWVPIVQIDADKVN